MQSHGGPTAPRDARCSTWRSLFWTSRGFGVVDVNYGGSTGYGRAYREPLHGQWGIVDMEDCVAAALYLAAEGEADGDRLAIHGGSAGGYTTLCALAFHDDFAAGASYYGVADAETLAADTHKFESRYLDALIGPYPETAELYRERSPIHYADRIDAPVMLFQGLEDEVVPPSQAEEMVAALSRTRRAARLPRLRGRAARLPQGGDDERCLEAELSFYAQVFGFEPADELEPVEHRLAARWAAIRAWTPTSPASPSGSRTICREVARAGARRRPRGVGDDQAQDAAVLRAGGKRLRAAGHARTTWTCSSTTARSCRIRTGSSPAATTIRDRRGKMAVYRDDTINAEAFTTMSGRSSPTTAPAAGGS